MDLNQTQLDALTEGMVKKFISELSRSAREQPSTEEPITVKLDDDRTIAFLPIGKPFRSIQVLDVSDAQVKIDVVIESTQSHKVAAAITFGVNDNYDYGRIIHNGWLKFTAQPGKWIKLLLSTDGSFRSGKQVSVQGGSVTPSYGDGMTAVAKVVVTTTGGVATKLVDKDATSKGRHIRHLGDGDPVVLGGTGLTNDAGARPGTFTLQPGQDRFFETSAEIYAIHPDGDGVSTIAITNFT